MSAVLQPLRAFVRSVLLEAPSDPYDALIDPDEVLRDPNAERRLRDDDEELPPPDEEGVDPDEALGQYVMPDERNDPDYANVPEDNTELEDRFHNALKAHYELNEHDRLRRIWQQLMDLDSRGLYQGLLRSPPGQTAYRILSTNAARAEEILGVYRNMVTAEPGVAQRAPNPPTYNPRSFISSWTLDPARMLSDAGSVFIPAQPGSVTILLTADSSSSGDFLMNPEGFARGWQIGTAYSSEVEIIGGGPIQLTGAAWMFHAASQGRIGALHQNSRKILDQLMKKVGAP